MKYIVKAATRKSRYHQQNEDNYICNDRYIIVADGMGGESDGDIASGIAVRTISENLNSKLDGNRYDDKLKNVLFSAIHKADADILSHVSSHPDSFGMGTTVVAIVRDKHYLHIAWCGDSRCYVFNPDKGISSLTKDHSYVQTLIDSGQITVEESFTHPDGNVITRFVGGGDESCIPEFTTYELSKGDIVIVCSDGLSGYCKDKDIERTVTETHDKDELTDNLMTLAINHGSDDDITVILMMESGGGHNSIFHRLLNK